MKVNKLIKSKIERDYFFVKGKLSIDCKYFITEIEKGIKREDNKSFKTNLISEMTSYRYFMADKKFQEMLLPISDMIDDNNFCGPKPYDLFDAWGYKFSFGNYTRRHDHVPSAVSGAIMLNKHSQTLYFPDIREELKCEPGSFVLFSPFLKHFTHRTKSDVHRYGISFNYIHGLKIF